MTKFHDLINAAPIYPYHMINDVISWRNSANDRCNRYWSIFISLISLRTSTSYLNKGFWHNLSFEEYMITSWCQMYVHKRYYIFSVWYHSPWLVAMAYTHLILITSHLWRKTYGHQWIVITKLCGVLMFSLTLASLILFNEINLKSEPTKERPFCSKVDFQFTTVIRNISNQY